MKETFIVLSRTGPKGINKDCEWGTLEIAGPPMPLIYCHWYLVKVPQRKGPIGLHVWPAEQSLQTGLGENPESPVCRLHACAVSPVPVCRKREPPSSMQLVSLLSQSNRCWDPACGTGNSYQRLINVSL